MIKKKDLKTLETTLLDVALVVRGFAKTKRTEEDEQQFLKELNGVIHDYLLGDFIYAALNIPVIEPYSGSGFYPEQIF